MRRRHFLGAATAGVAGLAGCMGDTEFTITDISVSETTGPLALEVNLVNAAATVDSPASLDITIQNENNKLIQIRNTSIWPLGLLGLSTPDGQGPQKVLLISDKYAETHRVEVTGNSIRGDDEPIVRPLEVDTSVTERYNLQGNRLYGTGNYTLRGFFDEILLSYRVASTGEWTEFSPEVSITVAERSLLP